MSIFVDFFVNYLAYTASILLLVVIAVERYIAIMHPLRARGFFTAPRLCVAQVVVWVVAAVYNVPILLMFDTMSTPAGAFCYMTFPLVNMKAYYTAHFVLWYVVPLLVILLMYGRISCTLWATSAAAIPASRRHSRHPSVSMAVALEGSQQNPPNFLPKCCLASHAERTCVSFCESDAMGENGFQSVVTVGVVAEGDGGGGGVGGGGVGSAGLQNHHGILVSNGGGGGVGGGGVHHQQRSQSGRNVFSSRSRLMDADDAGRRRSRGGVKLTGCCPSDPADKPFQRLLTSNTTTTTTTTTVTAQPQKLSNGGVELATFNQGCTSCFSCMGRGRASLHRADCRNTANGGDNGAVVMATAPGQAKCVGGQAARQGGGGCPAGKRPKLARAATDDYTYDLSDVCSSDDYDNYHRCRAIDGGQGNVGGGGGGGGNKGGVEESYFFGNGSVCGGGGGGGGGGFGGSLLGRRGGGGGGPKRIPRTHCRISSQRGLTSRRRVIRLLVAVVTIFAICVLPIHVRNLMHYWRVDTQGGVFDILSPLAAVMMYLNCGLNPLIYWMFSDHFRRSLRETLCFWKRRRSNSTRLVLNSPRQKAPPASKMRGVL